MSCDDQKQSVQRCKPEKRKELGPKRLFLKCTKGNIGLASTSPEFGPKACKKLEDLITVSSRNTVVSFKHHVIQWFHSSIT